MRIFYLNAEREQWTTRKKHSIGGRHILRAGSSQHTGDITRIHMDNYMERTVFSRKCNVDPRCHFPRDEQRKVPPPEKERVQRHALPPNTTPNSSKQIKWYVWPSRETQPQHPLVLSMKARKSNWR